MAGLGGGLGWHGQAASKHGGYRPRDRCRQVQLQLQLLARPLPAAAAARSPPRALPLRIARPRQIIDGIGKSTVDISIDCLARRGIFVSFGNASGAVRLCKPMRSFVSGSCTTASASSMAKSVWR